MVDYQQMATRAIGPVPYKTCTGRVLFYGAGKRIQNMLTNAQARASPITKGDRKVAQAMSIQA